MAIVVSIAIKLYQIGHFDIVSKGLVCILTSIKLELLVSNGCKDCNK